MSRDAPPDLRPGALLLSGVRRGALLVFVPVALAAQAVAWLSYAVSGYFHAWSWAKIGLAYALLSVRVPFEATLTARTSDLPAPTALSFELAIGALTVAILLLAYRAGRSQARGLEHRPGLAALSGAATGLGVALPMFLAAFLVRLRLPTIGIASLRPVLWASLVAPLAVTGLAGAAGGASAARGRLEAVTGWAPRLTAAARGGALAVWWGLVLGFVMFLVLAAAYPRVTTAYARSLSGLGGEGAFLVVNHALLLPNQSALLLAVSMGSPASFALSLGSTPASMTASLHELSFTGVAGPFVSGLWGVPETGVTLPTWFLVFLTVPAVATITGGRRAAADAPSRRERVGRGLLGGVVFALLAAAAAWAAGIVLSIGFEKVFETPSLTVDPVRTFSVALAWGVAGGVVGALLPPAKARAVPTPSPAPR